MPPFFGRVCIQHEQTACFSEQAVTLTEVTKGARGMPRLSEATKDVISCDKLGGGAHTRYIPRFPNGATPYLEEVGFEAFSRPKANPGN